MQRLTTLCFLTLALVMPTWAFAQTVNASAVQSPKCSFCVYFGQNALLSNTTGVFNTAFGMSALSANTTGSTNSAFGMSSLSGTTTGNNNVAVGFQSQASNATGNANVSLGMQSMLNATGSNNTALGHQSLMTGNGSNNTAIGYQSLIYNSGSYNTGVGYLAGWALKSGTNAAVIIGGVNGSDVESGQVAIGNGNGTETIRISAAGLVGVGTKTPVATLDVSGFARLKKYSYAPVTCSAATDGSLAMTTNNTLCSCKASVGAWVSFDGSTQCAW